MSINNYWRLQTPVSLQCSKCFDEDQLQENSAQVQSAHDQLVISSVHELQKDWMVIPSLNELHQCTGSECCVHPPRPRAHQRVATLFAHVWKTILVAMAWTCFARVQSIYIFDKWALNVCHDLTVTPRCGIALDQRSAKNTILTLESFVKLSQTCSNNGQTT